MKPPSRLIAILDLDTLGESLVSRAVQARAGGVDWMLLRAKSASGTEKKALAAELAAALPGVTLSLNCGALEEVPAGFDGVHHPSTELGKGRGAATLAGVSCHTAEDLRAAEKDGYDYCFLSPVFPPRSKESGGKTLGLEGFGQLARSARIPVYALGGIVPVAIAPLARNGAAGVAAIGGVFLEPDVTAASRLWVEALEEAFRRK